MDDFLCPPQHHVFGNTQLENKCHAFFCHVVVRIGTSHYKVAEKNNTTLILKLGVAARLNTKYLKEGYIGFKVYIVLTFSSNA